ncbi:MAG: hypothetical protein NC205_04465 [Prevotella sp.]|nr:hypothetical protein [Prevotella sp.]
MKITLFSTGFERIRTNVDEHFCSGSSRISSIVWLSSAVTEAAARGVGSSRGSA